MESNPVDRYLAMDVLKGEVEKEHKKAKREAEDFLADARDSMGVMSIAPKALEGCGEFKYAATRAKKAVQFNLSDAEQLEEWVRDNAETVTSFIKDELARFGKWCQDNTGEVPEGTTRVVTDVPAGYGAPKLYKVDADRVKEILSSGGNLLEGVNGLLLGDGDE